MSLVTPYRCAARRKRLVEPQSFCDVRELREPFGEGSGAEYVQLAAGGSSIKFPNTGRGTWR